MDAFFYGFVVLLFAAVILAVEGIYLWWMSTHGAAARRIARRLQIMSGGSHGRAGERISILKQRRYSHAPALDRLLHRLKPAHRIDALLVQSSATWTVTQFLACSLACMLLAFTLTFALPAVMAIPAPARALIAAGGLLLPWGLLRRMRMRRLVRIEHQLPASSRARCAPATRSPMCCKSSATNCRNRWPASSGWRAKRSTTGCR